MTEIRHAVADDEEAVEALYPAAFPDEDLLPIVRALFACAECRHFVGCDDGAVIGHAAFTLCGVGDNGATAALLGPVAVMPAWHGQGIGTALIKAGFAFVAKAGISRVMVLGDPAYYQRFGFAPDLDIDTPYLIPDEWADAWQSVRLLPEVQPSQGVLHVPEPWLDPALWAP